MSRSKAIIFLAGRISQLGISRVQSHNAGFSAMAEMQMPSRNTERSMCQGDHFIMCDKSEGSGDVRKHQIGHNVSRKDKIKFLVTTLSDLKDSKEAVYGAMDSWVAWEQNFPIASIKVALVAMEKDEQWHRIVQVIKWMLSKGQGTTMGTYRQLIKALDMDHRPEEAHKFWVKRIGIDLHSVPWELCKLMISIYYRNNMLECLIKLFKGLESFDRKPPEKSVVLKVANAYDLLGLHGEKERVLEKYNDLFAETDRRSPKKSKKGSSKKKNKSGENASTSDDLTNTEVTNKNVEDDWKTDSKLFTGKACQKENDPTVMSQGSEGKGGAREQKL